MNKLLIGKSDLNENNEYVASDFVSFDGDVEIQGGLGVVRFRGGLEATGSIRAKAGTGIEAGAGITAGAGGWITAGAGIRALDSEEMEVVAESIDGEVLHGTVRLIAKEGK